MASPSLASTPVRGFSTTPSSPPAQQFSTNSDNKTYKIGLIGARGYTGRELMGLIGGHPNMELVLVSSRELNGQIVNADGDLPLPADLKYSSLSADDCANITKQHGVDAWVMALPNKVCEPFVNSILQASQEQGDSEPPVIVDLSADYRFDDTDTWAYGLPEVNRENISTARLIANPGCYATGARLALEPFKELLHPDIYPTVFGVSGYSGAGTNPSPKNDQRLLKDNLMPYASTRHIHEREVSRHLGTPIAFSPHVASFFRGNCVIMHRAIGYLEGLLGFYT